MSPKLKRWIAWGFVAVVIVLLYLIHEVLLPFVLSGVFIYLMAPVVDWIARQKIFGLKLSRGFGVFLAYLGFFVGLAVLGLIVLPPLYEEVLKIANDLPRQIEQFRSITLPDMTQKLEALSTRYQLDINVEAFIEQTLDNLYNVTRSQVEALPSNMQTLVKFVFSTLTTLLVIFIVTGFVLIDLPRIKAGMLNLIPMQFRPAVLSLVHAIDRDLSGTIRGQLLICLINGTLTTFALLILQVKFAITIGFVAGVFSLIPVFGAVISTIPAVLIALTQSLTMALAVIAVIIVIHLIEANFLNPKILGHTVELHPAIIIFAIVVGEHFFGPVGLLFGVPVAAILRSFLKYFYTEYFLEPEALPDVLPLRVDAMNPTAAQLDSAQGLAGLSEGEPS